MSSVMGSVVGGLGGLDVGDSEAASKQEPEDSKDNASDVIHLQRDCTEREARECEV
jgi:hypothetical protein